MTPEQIRALVDEGITLNIEIAKREARLKKITKALKDAATADPKAHVPLKDKDREGSRFLATGTERIVPIIFTADSIRQSLPEGDNALTRLQELAGDHFGSFYKRTVSFDAVHVKSNKFDGVAFRAAARQLLPQPEEFIAAALRRDKDGVPVSSVVVNWDSLEPIATA